MNKNNTFRNKNIFVTGGSGSFGTNFIEFLFNNYNFNKIVIFSRDELKQYNYYNYLKKKYSAKKLKKLRFFLGDIRDNRRLEMATQDIDIIIHAAAIKHIDKAEYNPFEAIKTNVLGSQNVIEAALKNNVEKVLALSTDKASSPTNLYGATKLTSDKLFTSANNYVGKKKTIFSVVRYGNVMMSSGSVIPLFIDQFNSGQGYFTITNKEMTRFNITLKDGVKFVVNCLLKMWGGETFIPKIPSYKIIDLAKAINKDYKYKEIGIRHGEKIHEEMISVDDSRNTIEFKDYYVILPDLNYMNYSKNQFINKSNNSKGKQCPNGFKYSSNFNNSYLKVRDLKNLIDIYK